MTSSDKEETKGMIITPITNPAASALSEATSKPRLMPQERMAGATTSTANTP